MKLQIRKDAHHYFQQQIRGTWKFVKVLLGKGANKEVAFEEWTPLNAAARSGHVEVVKLLLEQGANKEATNRAGGASFILAAGSGHVEVVVRRHLEKESQYRSRIEAWMYIVVFFGSEQGASGACEGAARERSQQRSCK